MPWTAYPRLRPTPLRALEIFGYLDRIVSFAAMPEIHQATRSRARYPGTPESKYRPDRTRHRVRGACDRRLHLYSPAAALAGTRHHHRNCLRSPTATTQRQNVDAQGLAAPRRLD